MSSSLLRDACLELAWSLWTELGVPGIARRHREVIIDPEPLVLWSPAIVSDDPRLRDLVFAWCGTHGARMSTSRLRTLERGLPESTRRHFGRFARRLADASTVRWPAAPRGDDWPLPTDRREVPLPVERPALLRFRLRALAGVGARADTLHYLLAAWPNPLSAADVAVAGYGKRNVSRLLAELAEARIVIGVRRGNRIEYHLRTPALLGRLVGAGGAREVQWLDLLGVLAQLIDLEASWEQRSQTARRVQAHKVRTGISTIAEAVGLDSPPETEGNPGAFSVLLEWGAAQARGLADGSSRALARRRGWSEGSGTGAGDGDAYGAGAADGSGFGGYGMGTADGDGLE
jgi:DNA-binding transcriptional ArsR family regulator